MPVAERFYSLGDAESARLELAYYGIEAQIRHENTATMAPYFLIGTKGGIPLAVADDRLEEAREILGRWQAARDRSAGSPPFLAYALPLALGTGIGILLVEARVAGAILGLFLSFVLVTLFNQGVKKGYTAARAGTVDEGEDEAGSESES